ncbi:M56 family metallopeptidase [Rhodanobacter sp. KK11]|uniref:M56 family metallopeptidase n=1 Tax=Rhodanobacter sp. KK11 TaxID=3083255 RepID=UPI0029677A12|nr:M56 family metallopeptidase [Rhodanobacter sp. KK11]MDW2980562.1 M56 family metallopeptidase [Rhodanobacter sp. KK11]
MNSIELVGMDWTGIDWLGRGWLLLLAFTAAALLVAALRRPCRRLFGAERAFQLWLLPPLAMLTSQLPHAAETPVTVLPSVVFAITSAASALPTHAAAASAVDWRAGVVLFWLVGTVVSLGLAAIAQSRYRVRLRGASVVRGWHLPWPVLRAGGPGVGPALVGAWRCRIVLPADFEQRYDATEQTLILAHEVAHARRGDGWWCLLAHILAALCWFHPLAWWALAALRHDQELACDAAVLREHAERRRSYANAMLKTQSAAFALPVGCTWSPRHPLTERIAMLKIASPSRQRQNAGVAAGILLVFIVAGSVYAASAPQEGRATWKVQGDRSTWKIQGPEYQLDMQVELATDNGHHRHAETAALALCMRPAKAAMASVGNVQVEATIVPAGDEQVRVDLAVGNTGASPFAHRQLRSALDRTLHVSGTGMDGKQTYAIDVTPQAGCPARVLAAASPVRITEHVTNGTARAVAEAIAAKAGWTLVDPDALGNAPVTLSFNDMPAGTALQRVADLAGMKLALEGKRVRFEPK